MTTWYHGDRSLRTSFENQRWDRDRTTSSLNEEGPGIYFTSDYDQAASYGPHVVEMELPKTFRLLPKKRPTLKMLRELYESADPERQGFFLSNWDEDATRDEVLRKYAGQNTTLDAAVTLYGDLFGHDADAWVEAMRGLGYDGVVVDKSYGVKHLIVWAPEKLRNIREAEPPREDNPSSLKQRLLHARGGATLRR